jgi:hypothetical protein
MENLTMEQIQFIDSLKEKFNSVNQSNNRKGNLIDVSSIMDNEIKRKARQEEINAIHGGHKKVRQEQRLSDYNRLKSDVELMSLIATTSIDQIVIKSEKSVYTTICIQYAPKRYIYYNNEYDNNGSVQVGIECRVRLKEATYIYKEFETIEQLVASDEFKRKIQDLLKIQHG